MKKILIHLATGLACVAFVAGLEITQGMEWYVAVTISGIAFIIWTVIVLATAYQDKNSFAEAQKLEGGNAFKSDRERARYARWSRKDRVSRPNGKPLSDIVGRYRSRVIFFELLGAIILLPILIGFYSELETGVKFILLGLILLLVYLACSDIFGIRARRLYGRLAERQDFEEIERCYTESSIVGIPKNHIAFSDKYIILLTPKQIIPIPRECISHVSRADIIGGTSYNGSAVSAESELFFIRVYLSKPLSASLLPTANMYCVRLYKFECQLAFELAAKYGYPTSEAIEMK